jgi:tetratricopeptide (TPR) repeat protein
MRAAIVFAAWVLAFGALAAEPRTEVPPPAAKYLDPDPFARSDQTVDLNSMDNPLKGLDERIAEGSTDFHLWVERGYLKADRGDAKGAEADYAHAIALAAKDKRHLRFAHWSHGWALLGLGQPEAALAAWRETEKLHGGHPYWLPYTYAMGLWAAGRNDEAVAYYAAAARSFPERWGERAAVKTHSSKMKVEEQALLLEVFSEWEQRGRK